MIFDFQIILVIFNDYFVRNNSYIYCFELHNITKGEIYRKTDIRIDIIC